MKEWAGEWLVQLRQTWHRWAFRISHLTYVRSDFSSDPISSDLIPNTEGNRGM